MPGNQWKLPLNLAVGFHLIVAFCTVYLPGLIETKPKYEDIYTVDLVNLADFSPVEPAPAPAPEPEVTPPAESVPEKAVSIAPPAPEPVAAPPKAVSIKPLKRKIKKKVKPKPQVQQPDNSAAKRKQLADALRAQQQAEEEARILAEEAALEKKMLENTRRRVQTAAKSPTTKPAGATGPSGGNRNTAVENQYYAAIAGRLMALWSLPEFKNLDPNLEARVVITIRKNGQIADTIFEEKSGNMIFDRFVMKTLRDVGTLPPIPPVLNKERMEIGLKFTPGRIH